MSGKRVWTALMDEALRAMYPLASFETMANIIQVTEKAVRNRCSRLRLKGKQVAPWTPTELQQLKDAYALRPGEPVNLARVAKKLGRLKSNVCRKAQELGLTNQQRLKVVQPKLKYEHPRYRPDEISQVRSEITKARHRTRGHPRGMRGKHHTPEAKAVLGVKSKQRWRDVTPAQLEARNAKQRDTRMARYGTLGPKLQGEHVYSRARRGRRADLADQFFRSMWEANYARWLNWLKARGDIRDWRYEPKTFVFYGVTRGVLSYKPDFEVIEQDGRSVYHEVKGWMDDKSKAKLRRMAEFYPGIEIIVIGPAEYRALSKWSGLLPGWETDKAHKAAKESA